MLLGTWQIGVLRIDRPVFLLIAVAVLIVAALFWAAAAGLLWPAYWADAIGHLQLTEVRSAHIREVLAACAEGRTLSKRGMRLDKATIRGIRAVALLVFDAAWQAELIREKTGERYFLMIHGDATYGMPGGNTMEAFS